MHLEGHICAVFLWYQVVLAKEAGLCYAAMALVTDYDCWREEEDVEHVICQTISASASLAIFFLGAGAQCLSNNDMTSDQWTGRW